MKFPNAQRRRIGALLLLTLLMCGAASCRSAPQAQAVYLDGKLLTMEPGRPHAQAMAVGKGRILAVGTSREISAWIREDTQVIDLEGRTVVPGFIDAHSHLVFAGQMGGVLVDIRPPPIGRFDEVADIVEALRRRAQQTPPGQWIVAAGYDDTLLQERRHLLRSDLDAVSREHPVLALHISFHIAAANSMALAAAGINAGTPQPPGGVIRKDGGGEPTGVLEEPPAYGPLLAAVPQAPLELQLESLQRGLQRYVAQGVTTAQDGATGADGMALLREAERRDLLPIRVVALPLPEVARKLKEEGFAPRLSAQPDARLLIGPVKIIADGSIQGYTGYLGAPYHRPPAEDPDYRGYPAMPAEKLKALVDGLYAEGFRVAVHGNGDAAIDDILDAVEYAQRRHPQGPTRALLIHAQMAREDQLGRMAQLGMIPSFFVLHTYYWGDRHRDIFMGPARAMRMSPAHSADRRGMPFTLHTDAPVVPMEMLRLAWAAVNRTSSSGAVIGAEQRISPMRALRAMTLDAAYQYGLEEELGSLSPGKRADWVVLEDDPTAIDAARIDDIRVLETAVNGEIVYRLEAQRQGMP